MGRWVRVALLVLGLLILAGFVASLDLPAIISAVGRADAGPLVLAVLLLVANVTVKAARWRAMAGVMNQRPLSLAAAEAAILAGVAAASLTPGRGVELAKPLLLRASHSVPMATSTAAVIAERLRVSIPDAMLAFCAANLLGTVSFIPGGIGITEFSLAGIITLVTALGPRAAVAAAVLVDRALSYYLVVALGALILLIASRRVSVSGSGRG